MCSKWAAGEYKSRIKKKKKKSNRKTEPQAMAMTIACDNCGKRPSCPKNQDAKLSSWISEIVHMKVSVSLAIRRGNAPAESKTEN